MLCSKEAKSGYVAQEREYWSQAEGDNLSRATMIFCAQIIYMICPKCDKIIK